MVFARNAGRSWPTRRVLRLAGAALLAAGSVFGLGRFAQATAATGTTVYVSPTGSDSNSGLSPDEPVQSLQRAQTIVRTLYTAMSGDLIVSLADGYCRLTRPLTLTAADSGSNGHAVIWSAAPGARPVVAGSVRLTVWTRVGTSSIFAASAPIGLRTRQLYVAGQRAQRATGKVPVSLTKTSTGYTASAATMADWRDPSGQAPPEVSGNHDITSGAQVPASLLAGAGLEFAYTALLNWTQVPPPS